jgi:hypothetical protein
MNSISNSGDVSEKFEPREFVRSLLGKLVDQVDAQLASKASPQGAEVSEAVSKKRGRPRVLDERVEPTFQKLFPELGSRRSLQNRAYSSHAASVLRKVPDCLERYRWLFGERGADGATWRLGVLVELGRFRDEQSIVNLAEAICLEAKKRRLTTSEAAALVRRGRGKMLFDKELCRSSQDGIVSAICAALDQYQRKHPDTELQDILEALNEAYGIVSEMTERSRVR